MYDEARGGIFARPPVFESGAGGIVSTAADLLAFARMMLAKGSYRGERILSRPSLEIMTTDQLTDEQKAASPFFPRFWDAYGWGLGMGVVVRKIDVKRSPGAFGWDGACTTSWWIDPKEHLIGILMSQHLPSWMDMKVPDVIDDFWTAVYQAIDD